MRKIKPVLAEVGELLADLTVKLRSATPADMPGLIEEAEDATRTILTCCLASEPVDHLPPGEVAALRAELVRLGEALEAQITGIIEIRWAQLGRGSASTTLH